MRLLAACLMLGCGGGSSTALQRVPEEIPAEAPAPAPPPTRTAMNLDYYDLFVNGEAAELVASSAVELRALAQDPAQDPFERLLAAEALFQETGSHPEGLDLPALHAAAMRVAPMHNPWGLPGAPELFGKRLVALGPAATEALRPLLGDQTELEYDGSETPSISAMMGYRVADLAAALICLQQGREFPEERDPGARDAWIAATF